MCYPGAPRQLAGFITSHKRYHVMGLQMGANERE